MPDEPIIVFDHLAGAAVHYARAPVATYGTRGKGPRRQRLRQSVHQALTAALEELWSLHPWGRAEVIVSAGAMVPQSDRRGPGDRHVQGRAYDLDAIWWPGAGRRLVTLEAPDGWPHYLAVEAVLRRHLGTVLGWHYNEAHRDHWHIDDGSPVGWGPRSRSRVTYLQAALVHVWGQSVAIDGVWGPRSEAAAQAAAGGSWSWPEMLLATARRGLEAV
jgi:hypothetical protein